MKFAGFDNWLNENTKEGIIVLLPGGFKPMHIGHVDLVRRYAEHPDVKEVKVLIGPGIRNGIDQNLSLKIAEELLASYDNVTVEAVKYPSPILTCYKYIETAKPGTYAMAGVNKGDDYRRVVEFVRNLNKGGKYYKGKPKGVKVVELSVDTEPIYYEGRTDDKEGQPISASTLRRDILNDDYENFRTNYPGYIDEVIENIWDMLKPIVVEADSPEYENELNEAITPQVNKHMTHAEDLVILGGQEGLQWVVEMFKELYEKLKSDTEKDKIRLSVKFDGAPSVFVWSSFPGLEKSGLAIKALFAKDPKLMFSKKDVDRYYKQQPDLAYKLKIMLQHISSIGIPKNEIWQGDFLFDKTTLKTEKDYYSFHPNTIVYKVKKDSEIAKAIEKAEVGVVWHTRYKGKNLSEISAKYNTKVEELTPNDDVFMTDPYIASLAGYVTLTEEESDHFNELIEKLENNAKNFNNSKDYKAITKEKDFIALFATFQNSLIKRNVHVENPEQFLTELVKYINEKFTKEIEAKKTIKGKEAVAEKEKKILELAQSDEVDSIVSMMIEITKLKNMFIKKLNNITKFETYLETNSGRFLTTGDEGFAISDMHGNVVKLVDRYEFSFANFSPRIKKGWAKQL
jgi:Family of unknown function (DUF6267)